ncbi:MAG TPA: response regulator [Methanospirillum sp.]|nr:response regulator [Methanospirillum sp.]
MIRNQEMILVVEDDAVQQKIIGALLQKMGYLVSFAANGIKALEYLDSHSCDLILLDLVLPEMDGYQVIEAMKSSPALRNIPIIIISSIEDIESINQCISMGAADYLIKPVNPKFLSARITGSLANKRLHDQEIIHYQEMEKINKKLELMNNITRHDLANQIQVISCTLNMLLSGEKEGDFLAMAVKATNDVREILTFARQYQDIGKKQPQWHHITSVIEKNCTDPTFEGLEINTDIPSLQVYADNLLEKVFYNLLENSVRHGETVTTVFISGEEVPEGYLLVYADNGVGVEEKNKERIFHHGYGKNTGLGLFLIREILAISGITIHERGVAGEGVRFEMRIPEGVFRLTPSDNHS